MVVVTGDLVDRGTVAEYRVLRDLIDRVPLPLYLLPGNHDDSQAFLEVFCGSRFVADGDLTHYCVEPTDLTLICLDSSVAGSPGGTLSSEQLGFTDDVLTRRPDVPALVALHHPPVNLGMPFLDSMGLANGSELVEVLDRHRNVVRVLAGHVHRPVVAPMSSTILVTAASTHLASGLVLDDAIPNYAPEPTTFQLHVQTGRSWVTHTVSVSHAASPLVCF